MHKQGLHRMDTVQRRYTGRHEQRKPYSKQSSHTRHLYKDPNLKKKKTFYFKFVLYPLPCVPCTLSPVLCQHRRFLFLVLAPLLCPCLTPVFCIPSLPATPRALCPVICLVSPVSCILLLYRAPCLLPPAHLSLSAVSLPYPVPCPMPPVNVLCPFSPSSYPIPLDHSSYYPLPNSMSLYLQRQESQH